MSKNMKHDQSMIRKHHSLVLFRLIKDLKPISRVDLAKITKMSGTSVGRIVKVLIEQGFVNEVGQTKGNVGRKATLLEINSNGALTIGVSLDVDSLQIGVVDLHGNILHKITDNMNLMQKPEEVLDCVVDKINKMCQTIGTLSERIVGVGISIPGIISWPEGQVKSIPQFHWKDVEVKRYVEHKLGRSVFVDNQVKTELFGESLFGSMIGKKNCVCIYVGSGVGGAVMEDGEILRGAFNALGEIGHITIDPGGPLCDCGRFGCLQTYVCLSALEKEAAMPSEKIYEAERLQEPWAVSLLERAAVYLAMAISNVVCMYNPQAILLTGKMIDQWPEWVERVLNKYKQFLWEPLSDSFEISFTGIGQNSGLIGASSLVINAFLQSPFENSNTQLYENSLVKI